VASLDLRIMRVGVEVNGQLSTYEGLAVQASGTKFANPLQDECAVTVANLSRDVRQFLLTETSPFNKNRTPKRIRVEAGRISTGLSIVFQGDITEASPGPGPDIVLDIKAKTGNFAKSNIIAMSQPGQTPLSRIARQVADALSLSLTFEATDKQIANYAFTGAALKQVDKLAEAGAVDAFVDGSQLIVKNRGVPLAQATHVLSADSGLIGLPELTEQGVRVRYLYDPNSRVGGRLELVSQLNPALSGSYEIYKLAFELASHEQPWYTIAEAKRL
jgi:hypothetical protein